MSSEHGAHYRTLDRVGVRGRKATCSCGWGRERGGWGPRGSSDPHRSPYLAWLLQEGWRAHAGLEPSPELLPDGYDYWGEPAQWSTHVPPVLVRPIEVPPELPAGAYCPHEGRASAAPPLICQACSCAWPDLTPDPDGEVVHCGCGAEMRARRRREQS